MLAGGLNECQYELALEAVGLDVDWSIRKLNWSGLDLEDLSDYTSWQADTGYMGKYDNLD